MTSRRLALGAAVAGVLVVLPGRSLGEHVSLDQHLPTEEVSLLQAELVSKARSSRSTLKDDGAAMKQPSCEAFAMDMPALVDSACGLPASEKPPMGAWAAPTPTSGARGAAEQGALLEKVREAPAAAAPQADLDDLADAEEQASPSMLGLVLEVLIVALCFDGLRRLKTRPAAEAAEAAEDEARCIQPGAEFDELMRAALAGDAKLCEKLLQGVSRITGQDVWGCTVLHAAAKGGSTDVVRKLLGLNVCVHDCDAWDETPLHLAARAGITDACDLLLAHGANIDAINAQDWTPLVVAADAGHMATSELLLNRGAGTAGLADEELPPMLASLIAQRLLLGSDGEQDVLIEESEGHLGLEDDFGLSGDEDGWD